mmetsp:Transcript_70767/g.194158  ORF Transcript_70767/g.194158 Transcript_70767/m.194158 type:complete len:252 (+) Transcript_70767:34-789(+)
MPRDDGRRPKHTPHTHFVGPDPRARARHFASLDSSVHTGPLPAPLRSPQHTAHQCVVRSANCEFAIAARGGFGPLVSSVCRRSHPHTLAQISRGPRRRIGAAHARAAVWRARPHPSREGALVRLSAGQAEMRKRLPFWPSVEAAGCVESGTQCDWFGGAWSQRWHAGAPSCGTIVSWAACFVEIWARWLAGSDAIEVERVCTLAASMLAPGSAAMLAPGGSEAMLAGKEETVCWRDVSVAGRGGTPACTAV